MKIDALVGRAINAASPSVACPVINPVQTDELNIVMHTHTHTHATLRCLLTFVCQDLWAEIQEQTPHVKVLEQSAQYLNGWATARAAAVMTIDVRVLVNIHLCKCVDTTRLYTKMSKMRTHTYDSMHKWVALCMHVTTMNSNTAGWGIRLQLCVRSLLPAYACALTDGIVLGDSHTHR